MLRRRLNALFSTRFLYKPLNLALPPIQSFSNAKTRSDKMYFDKNNPFFNTFRTSFLLDDFQIFQFFRNPSFFAYMNENFRILPFLLDPKKVSKFRQSFIENKRFQDHVYTWFQYSQDERINLAREFPTTKAVSGRRISILRPFIELYLEYLQDIYPKELEISISLSSKTDLRMPHEWYPQARKLKRKIIYHHGPTNSGKTFTALESLEKSDMGIYCAPLRLLAWEIHDRLESKGILCDLITGQEKVVREGSGHVSCTIETSNLSDLYEVAVIDEVQMIGNEERGAAWTNALLGLQASTIHLCGEGRALSLVNKLCQVTGDELEERKYERYSRVFLEGNPFDIKDLQEGDCIITFSTRNVHRMKNLINEINNELYNSCAVIYGKLPPETRKEQAKKFNDRSSNLKYLIATNAIGMGVNLKIRRVIFQSLTRMSAGGNIIQIDDNEIRQIAGRAGRYTETGYVACMKPSDGKIIKNALKSVNSKVRKDITVNGAIEVRTLYRKTDELGNEVEVDIEKEEEFLLKEEVNVVEERALVAGKLNDGSVEATGRSFLLEESSIIKAGIFPQFQQIDSFSKDLELFENTKSTLSEIFKKFVSIAQLEGTYFIQKYDDFCEVADMLEKSNLSLKDHFVFSSAPINLNDKWKKTKKCIKQFANSFVKYNLVKLPDMFDQGEPIFLKRDYTLDDLNLLEEMHHILDLYLWLGQKYSQAFIDRERAVRRKVEVCELIEKILDKVEPLEYKSNQQA